jgi:hypothetical protein
LANLFFTPSTLQNFIFFLIDLALTTSSRVRQWQDFPSFGKDFQSKIGAYAIGTQ